MPVLLKQKVRLTSKDLNIYGQIEYVITVLYTASFPNMIPAGRRLQQGKKSTQIQSFPLYLKIYIHTFLFSYSRDVKVYSKQKRLIFHHFWLFFSILWVSENHSRITCGAACMMNNIYWIITV